MKNVFCDFSAKKIATVLLCFVALSLTGCKKKGAKDINHTDKFDGNWSGTMTCSGGTPNPYTLVIAATDNETITTNYTLGTGVCAQGHTLTGTASGQGIKFNTVTLVDGCGVSYSVSGAGSIISDKLTLSFSATSGGITRTCTFSGNK